MNRGLTLVELLIYVGLSSLVLTSLIYWFININDLSARSGESLARDESTRFASQVIASLIRKADSVVLPAAGATSDSLQLVLAGMGPATISLVDGQIWLDDGLTSEALTLPSPVITSLQFSNLAAVGQRPTIKIETDLFTTQVTTRL